MLCYLNSPERYIPQILLLERKHACMASGYIVAGSYFFHVDEAQSTEKYSMKAFYVVCWEFTSLLRVVKL